MVITRVRPLSVAKIVGFIYCGIGLVFGAVFATFAAFGAAIGASASGSAEPFIGLLFGGAAVIVLPLFYGALGFLLGLFAASLFNLASRLMGGLEIEVA